jgi:amidase|tara:strand:- start:302 stop:1744 length:1443 start_codon:yes stop_codon:yes gene_type:complete
MNIQEYASQDAIGLATMIRKNDVSIAEVHKIARQAIEAVNPQINALAAPLFDTPLDFNIKGPFAGVPFAIKDLFCHAADVPMQFGSRMVPPDFSFPYDTSLMKRWREAGLATLARTTVPDFGWNVNTEPLVNGPTRNPWNTDRIAGGSSGGSCALVAAGGLPIAHGNDGGGSIRCPAAWCGLVGLKPTRGRVSFAPDMAEALFGSAIEFAVTRTVRDAAALLDVAEGPEIGEKYEIARPTRPYLKEVGANPGKLRIAVSPTGWSSADVDPDCVSAVEKTAAVLIDMGHYVEEASPKFDVEAFNAAGVTQWSVALADIICGLAEELGKELTKDNLEATLLACVEHGKRVSGLNVLASEHAMNATCRAVGSFFKDYDVLLTPTVACPAPTLGSLNANEAGLDAAAWTRKVFSFAPFTFLFNVTGQPAISLPLCINANGLPIGLQFVAHFGDEATLFRLAAQLEIAMPWVHRKPRIHAAQQKE